MPPSTKNSDGSSTLTAPNTYISPEAFTATETIPPTTTFDASLINKNQADGGTSPTFPPAPNSATSASNSAIANVSIPNPIPPAENVINDGAQTTPAEAKNTSLLNKVASLIGMGQTKERLESNAENSANVPGLTKIVNDLSTQLNGLNDQATALANDARSGGAIENQEQQDILKNGNITTTAGLAPKSAGDLRKNQIQQSAVASQALTVKAALYGAQGNLTLAKNAADKAADAQYADDQHQIDYVKALIEANKPQMSKEEKAQADIVTAKLADRQNQIDNAKEDKKTIIAMATAALKNNPDDSAAQYAAQQALAESNKAQPDLKTAFDLIGKYQSDPVATQQAIANLALTRANTAKAITDANTPKAATASQTTYANYAPRLETADNTIKSLTTTVSKLPTASFLLQEKLPSALQTSDIQAYNQAKSNFINAVLRQESGAAISDTERASYDQQYFPQPGDSDSVIAQKAQNRAQVVASYKTAAGPAYVAPLVAQDIEPTDRSKGATWNRSDGKYVSDGSQWVKQ